MSVAGDWFVKSAATMIVFSQLIGNRIGIEALDFSVKEISKNQLPISELVMAISRN